MDDDELERERICIGRDVVHLERQRQGSEDYCVPYRRHKIGQLHQLLRVQSYLLFAAQTDALTDDRYHRKPHRLTRYAADSVEVICDCVSRYLNRSERGYNADNEYAPEVKQAALDAAGYSYREYLFYKPEIRPEFIFNRDINRTISLVQEDEQEEHRRKTRNSRGCRRASNTPFDSVYENGVADYVHNCGDERG